MNQPTAKPTRKVTAGGIGAAASTVLVWGLGLAHIDMPAIVAAAVTGLLSWAASYLVPERDA